tara:strand:+ start:12909 stop:13637 length:729 start_codon:yes stop_codon:yes gene_type:complete
MHITHQSKPVVFIADIHLSDTRPDITQAFHQFLNQIQDIDALYIMGDLFEVWLGEDVLPPRMQETLEQLRQASQRFPIYFTCGNRDFLLHAQSATNIGMISLPDIQKINLFGTPTLIMHGDTLCTEDKAYQKYRACVHQNWLQKLFLRLPKWIRLKVYRHIYQKSKQGKQGKTIDIMDASPQAVEQALRQHQAERIIHGHTHRPKLHEDAKYQRWVVGDWYQQSSVLIVHPDGYELKHTPFS